MSPEPDILPDIVEIALEIKTGLRDSLGSLHEPNMDTAMKTAGASEPGYRVKLTTIKGNVYVRPCDEPYK
jgi:hypothetical protein